MIIIDIVCFGELANGSKQKGGWGVDGHKHQFLWGIQSESELKQY